MTDQKQNKTDKAGQQSGTRGFDKQDQDSKREASPAGKHAQKPDQDENEDIKQPSKHAAGRQNQNPQGDQGGMRAKGRNEDDEMDNKGRNV